MGIVVSLGAAQATGLPSVRHRCQLKLRSQPGSYWTCAAAEKPEVPAAKPKLGTYSTKTTSFQARLRSSRLAAAATRNRANNDFLLNCRSLHLAGRNARYHATFVYLFYQSYRMKVSAPSSTRQSV